MRSKLHIAVIGAGAFGGWTALHLRELGARVTLVDAWGPGNSRASSGGETRIMRCAYGADERSTEMAARALKLWAKYERKWKRKMLHRAGVLWMAGDHDDAFERESVKTLRGIGAKFEELSTARMKKRWPQINFEGIRWAIFEPESGYLEARASCAAVVEAFTAVGGRYLQAAVSADGVERGEFVLSDGAKIKADVYVFACGPWLGKLFPTTVGDLIRPTKQDIFFFGAAAGDTRFDAEHMPVWGDHHGRFLYGIPGSDRRGFKVADDTRGAEFDPTTGERVVSPETLAIVREYVGFRFPGLKGAPLVETRVCQYEQTPDENFIVDRHPAMENVWIVGGGSGHGFKHGPALGEMVAGVVLGKRELVQTWRLGRFRS
jgi:glycine/D-amino acid oxidase-like deaminating enzyme